MFLVAKVSVSKWLLSFRGKTGHSSMWLYSGVRSHVTGTLPIVTQCDIASVIERAKHQHAFEYFADIQHSSLVLYRTMQPEYKYAEYLSVVKCVSNRRLISRFRTGCHGRRVDTGRWAGCSPR